MRATQNLPDQNLTVITEAVSGLPGWVGVIVAVLLVASVRLPRILRALDDRRITKTACTRITNERAAVEALRIVNAKRWIIGRPYVDSTPTSNSGFPNGVAEGVRVEREPRGLEAGEEPP